MLLNNVSAGGQDDFATPIGKGTYDHHGWLVLFNRSTTATAHEIRLYLNPDPPIPGDPITHIAATIPAPSGGWVAGQWYHYAFTRSGSTVRGCGRAMATPTRRIPGATTGTRAEALALQMSQALVAIHAVAALSPQRHAELQALFAAQFAGSKFQWAPPQWHVLTTIDGELVACVRLFQRVITIGGQPLRVGGELMASRDAVKSARRAFERLERVGGAVATVAAEIAGAG